MCLYVCVCVCECVCTCACVCVCECVCMCVWNVKGDGFLGIQIEITNRRKVDFKEVELLYTCNKKA